MLRYVFIILNILVVKSVFLQVVVYIEPFIFLV